MAKSIMIQGTMSNAGKSLLTAGLCRILRQDGYRVAPFKSQNMALNSYITADGLEMGRAQAMQAEAAGILPTVEMNPILLKPTNDTGSQVIVNGEVLGTMRATDYFRRKRELIPQIVRAYQRLEQQFDVIVLEGAGSPAEINLKQDDIVNMGMARLSRSPVLLVGDIDRGGVFASLAGTLLLLEREEREMVKGLIINKFRGDRSILQPGLEQIEDITQKPVLGVVPYLQVDVEEEDSLSSRLERRRAGELVDVAVIRLPRISNFTDFDSLDSIRGMGVRYVTGVRELGRPDLVILPGTKNTMADLLWLRQCGLEAAVIRLSWEGVPVLGICGGYQMLGQQLEDPHCVEEGGVLRGIGLLPTKTVFLPQKRRTQVQGTLHTLPGALQPLSGCVFQGYEIHMGVTQVPSSCGRLGELRDGQGVAAEGAAARSVYGTYVHGIFDSDQLRQRLFETLCRNKGIQPQQQLAADYRQYREEQYDKLASGVRAGLDMEAVYRILEQGL